MCERCVRGGVGCVGGGVIGCVGVCDWWWEC